MRASRSSHLALFGLSASVLMLQVALTRIFSVLLWNHSTFLIISMALLGFGAAGSALAVRRSPTDEEAIRRSLSRNSVLFALTAIVGVLIVTRLGLDATQVFLDAGHMVKLAMVYTILAIPYFFAGLAICLLLSLYSGQVNTLYFSDLCGAGVGAFAVTILLDVLGAPATVLASCALAVGSAVLFASASRRLVPGGLLLLLAILTVFVQVKDPWDIPVSEGKGLRGQEHKVEDRRWTLHSRIDVVKPINRPLRFGSGVSARHMGRKVEYRTFFMDGGNPSRMIRYDQGRWFLEHLLTAAPYSQSLDEPLVLIIGSGGGIDTMVALKYGAKKITAIEINPETVALVKGDYSEYIGDVFQRKKVDLRALEGRHFLTLTDERFDVIRMTGVDTKAAAAVGANALDHAYLYTEEAIRDLWAHLTDDGMLAITRPTNWQDARLIDIMIQALADQAPEGLARNLVVASNGRWSEILLRRREFREDEVESLRDWADRGGHAVLYDPFTQASERYETLIRGDRSRVEDVATFQIVTDDRPFFFERTRLADVLGKVFRGEFESVGGSGYLTLLMTLAQAIVLAAFFILFPLWKNRIGAGQKTRRWATLICFSALGMGFILVELVFIQKYMFLLGGPSYAMSVTLFSILLFSGIGALLAKKIPLRKGPIHWVLLVLVVLLFAALAFLKLGLGTLLGLGFVGRVGVAVLALAPVGILLGMPFPLGIRLLDRDAPRLIPWAWASNGCFSVIGSVLCIILSMNWSFSAAFQVAIGCYVVAALCLSRMSGSAKGQA